MFARRRRRRRRSRVTRVFENRASVPTARRRDVRPRGRDRARHIASRVDAARDVGRPERRSRARDDEDLSRELDRARRARASGGGDARGTARDRRRARRGDAGALAHCDEFRA